MSIHALFADKIFHDVDMKLFEYKRFLSHHDHLHYNMILGFMMLDVQFVEFQQVNLVKFQTLN